MKQGEFILQENTALTDSVYRMILSGDTSAILAPGQFVNIRLDGYFLRRPISVCDYTENSLTLIYKVIGHGTAQMSSMKPGMKLDVLTGLGNGYDISAAGKQPLLIGGGVGVPPLYHLAKRLIRNGCDVTVILGFNTAAEIFYEDEFKRLGCTVEVTTVDGSYGTKGFVTAGMKRPYSYYYACGPEPMLKAVFSEAATNGEMSFEERMGCGFGACMGCSCKTVTGFKRICTEGPVMKTEDILW